MSNQKMTFHVESRRIDARRGISHCKRAEISLDTDLAAFSACMTKGIERVTPILKFTLQGVEVYIRGVWQHITRGKNHMSDLKLNISSFRWSPRRSPNHVFKES